MFDRHLADAILLLKLDGTEPAKPLRRPLLVKYDARLFVSGCGRSSACVAGARDPAHVEGLGGGDLLSSELGYVPASFRDPAPQMEALAVLLMQVTVGDVEVFVAAPEHVGSMQALAEGTLRRPAGTAQQIGEGVALAGVVSGFFLGRRQVRDQAAVEHGQWLRGQRQDAYVALLDAWDTAVKEFQEEIDQGEYFDEIAAHEEARMGDSFWEDHEESTAAHVDRISEGVQRPLERVLLLGPDLVDKACINLAEALEALGSSVRSKSGTSGWPNYDMYRDMYRNAGKARSAFLDASRESMRAAPRPGR
ncbi:hypothetical protein OHA19_00715 [Streptomyces sp. NBC_00012]